MGNEINLYKYWFIYHYIEHQNQSQESSSFHTAIEATENAFPCLPKKEKIELKNDCKKQKINFHHEEATTQLSENIYSIKRSVKILLYAYLPLFSFGITICHLNLTCSINVYQEDTSKLEADVFYISCSSYTLMD